MKILSISDVHIKEPTDEAHSLFLKFLNSDEVGSADVIYLLGDIFDLMIGGYKQYLYRFPLVFNAIEGILEQGKVVKYIEGNHDFHIKRLLTKRYKNFSGKTFFHLDKPQVERVDGRSILFCHGDEIEIDNPNYKIYRSFIKSKGIQFLSNHVVPFHLVDMIGQNASQKSRKYSSNYDTKMVEEKFRKSALKAIQKYKVDMVVAGHSHVKDHFQLEGVEYINNGFFPISKTFIKIENQKASLVEV